ncbi:hypothetical protein BTO18_08815 [Polaribacter porphyrae]|uniref:Thioredoxin domain-containing protein n=1 Tax=Polaribacter porphyrae TaxID=1137780 RepID=A0A2S7WUF8_9FLAO|nr:hypothetical protein BTO18_08815 [Polaribacter porphyrae]
MYKLLLLFLLISSCNETSVTKFSLKGKTNKFKDGTTLYLSNNNTLIDSTKVKNNSFEFHTVLPTSPLDVFLRTKNYSHYRYLWLENKAMTFDARKTNFKNAIVTGSKSEELNFNLYKNTDSLTDNEILNLEIEFIKEHPSSIISASILSSNSSTLGRNKVQNLYELLSEENKNSKYGKQIAQFVSLNKELKIGDHFIDFEMLDNTGIPKKLSDTKAKAILLEFWASWCSPCRKENPNLVNTYKKYKPKGFEIFAVSLDGNKNNWLKAIKQDHLNWIHVSDLKGSNNRACLIYGIDEIPKNFLIDKNGIIIGKNLKGLTLKNKLKETLK